jgi:fructose-1,6-bisphosphatase
VTMYVFEQVRSYDVKVEVWQEVNLVQNAERHSAITYRTSGLLGITSISDFRNVRDAVGDQIDVFLNDYLTMNPKK